jgi:hypothetical protein
LSRTHAIRRTNESPAASEERRESGVARIALPRMIPRAPAVPSVALAPAEDENAVLAVAPHGAVPASSTLAPARISPAASALLLTLALLAAGAVLARVVAAFFP